ncbi:MAG: IS1182 family transposase [Deinococcota bacterium]|nr:IS1182 family transposase [Deinococcota bacterium]
MLRAEAVGEIPTQTVRVVKAAFPKGSTVIKLRDAFGTLYQDEDFAPFFSSLGQPALAPWRLALITVFQFLENLSDRQAADAVRGRLDWKYALGLELEDSGFHFSVLGEFRARLVENKAEQMLLDKMLLHFKDAGLLKVRGHARTDSTHVLASVRQLHKLEMVGETMRAALNGLAAAAPEWLAEWIKPEWAERYGHRVEDYRLPKGKVARDAYGLAVAEDGYALLDALELPSTPSQLRELKAVVTLRACWEQYFVREDKKIRWRGASELRPSGERLNSPYDPEACYSTRRDIAWIGYKVHFTETCDPGDLHLVTHVETTSAVIQDVTSTADVHDALARKELLPDTHIVDKGYTDADLLATSLTEHEVTLVGPVRKNSSWQALAGQGFDTSQFQVDWATQTVTCPRGQHSVYWKLTSRSAHPDKIYVKFDRHDCNTCAAKALCTKSPDRPRQLVLQPEAQQEALRQARDFIGTEAWSTLYRERAGIEGTLAQGIRSSGLRQTRYRGLAKTSLQNTAIGAAINIARVVSWLDGKPQAATRQPRFTRLAA